jgi:hypothetical protein
MAADGPSCSGVTMTCFTDAEAEACAPGGEVAIFRA